MSDKIITVDHLREEDVKALISGKVLAIRIPGFLSPEICKPLSKWYQNHPDKVNYTHELYIDGKLQQFDYGVTRIGSPYNLTYGKSPESVEFRNYYEHAPLLMQEIREVCNGTSPIDKLRLQLNEAGGAELARFDGKPMFAGIGRITRPQATRLAEQPHFDSLPVHYNLDAQFSANIYLEMPEQGGELEIWDHEPLAPEVIANSHPEKDWRSELGESILIKPMEGDLIIINSRKAHAVKEYQDGIRVSTACFIGYKKGKPLMLWS